MSGIFKVIGLFFMSRMLSYILGAKIIIKFSMKKFCGYVVFGLMS